MLSIKRLNLDSSWHIEYGKNSFVVDPWLIGSEIDGFKWLNEQWHIKEPVKISDLPEFQFLLISQNYEDHCHIETLKNISDKKPIIATDKAFKKLKKKFPNRKILHLKENEITECGVKKNLKIVDLTGAGDLFAAGFLHGHVNNMTQKDCLEKGTEMSSKVIQQIGARI